MNSIIVTVGTVTYAIKLRKLLTRAGIRSKLIKTEEEYGCLYGVEIDNSDFYKTVVIMKENNISYSVKNGL